MGILDRLFGGGTKLTLTLDSQRVIEGGTFGGVVELDGGRRAHPITSLRVSLLRIAVRSKEGSALPEVETQTLVDANLAANQELPAGQKQRYAFRINLPPEATPTEQEMGYQVNVRADIPGVKDPSQSIELRIMAREDCRGLALDETAIRERWPGLSSDNETLIITALRGMLAASYSEAERMIAAEPLIAKHIHAGSPELRAQALNTWSNLLNGRARKEHIATLAALSKDANLPSALFDQLIVAAARFAEEGALSIFEGFLRSKEANVRRRAVQALRSHSDEFYGKKSLILEMAQDADPGVRAEAVASLPPYLAETRVFDLLQSALEKDADPKVREAAAGALALGYHHYAPKLILDIYEKHLQSPNEGLRAQIAQSLSGFPAAELGRTRRMIEALLQDPSIRVREIMAFQLSHLGLEDASPRFRELAPLAQRVAESDPSAEVRKNALAALAHLMEPDEAVDYYLERVQSATSEAELYAMVNGVLYDRAKSSPQAKALIEAVARSPQANVAQYAGELLREWG